MEFKLTNLWKRGCLLARMLIALWVFSVVSGCRTAEFYRQAAVGQWQIITKRQSIAKLLENPDTNARLKQQLRKVKLIREFAEKELGLAGNGSYSHYLDLERPYVVWNVHAAPEYSLEEKTWWYPLIGRQSYRGYFSEKGARQLADSLISDGYEVHIGGVDAFSTLGWFRDPVLNTFIEYPPASLAAILFHELAHQRLYVKDKTDFNEAFATTVEQEGVRRFLQVHGTAEQLVSYERELEREGRFFDLVTGIRKELEDLYQSVDDCDVLQRPRRGHLQGLPDGGNVEGKLPERGGVDTASCFCCAHTMSSEEILVVSGEKQQILESGRRRYRRLKEQGHLLDEYDRWFGDGLNNARLNMIDTYHDLVPWFRELLNQQSGNLELFYEEVERLSKLPETEWR